MNNLKKTIFGLGLVLSLVAGQQVSAANTLFGGKVNPLKNKPWHNADLPNNFFREKSPTDQLMPRSLSPDQMKAFYAARQQKAIETAMDDLYETIMNKEPSLDEIEVANLALELADFDVLKALAKKLGIEVKS